MTVRSLTQTEAEERAALLSVDRYDLEVDLTALPSGPEVRCRSRVTFTARTPGATSFVDCAADVVSATLNGHPLDPPVEGRIVLADLAESNVLVVESVQARTADGEGVHRAVDPADGEVYLWTSFEPDEARFVWACFDQPDLKAPFGITVTAPAAWQVLSNSSVASVSDAGETREWSFEDTPPLSTYNPVVLAGPFHELRRTIDGYDLGLQVRRSLAGVLERDAEEIFEVTAQGLAFFGERFGLPFPQGKYDQVFLPEFGGAMENYGCVAWADSFLRRTEPTPAEMLLLVKVLLHEMAHMWFGNIVTMRWWDDLWLNEAFAEFACNWAALRATRHTDAWADHLAEDQVEAYMADQGPMSHPIRMPIRDVEEAASIFDAITYPKGATVLWQLMTYVGEERFSTGMTTYFARHAWANTTLQDLMDALAEASGRDLDAWRQAWLDTAGTDRLVLERGDESEDTVFRAVLTAAGANGGAPRPHVTTVGVYRDSDGGLERMDGVQVEVLGPRTDVALPADGDLYLPNDDNVTFATVRPDPASRTTLMARAGDLPTPLSRGVAVATVWDMLYNAELSAADTVHCLLSVARGETLTSLVEAHLGRAADAAELWSSDAGRGVLMAEVAGTARELSSRDDLRRVALRTVARCGDAGDLTWLQEADGDDVDLRWRVQVRLAELGLGDDAEVERLLADDPDPDAWVRALTVRAATGTAEAKAEAWNALVVERRVPIGTAGLVGRTMWRPGQDAVLAPYAQRYLDALPRLDEGGMIPAMVLTARLFPMFTVDAGYLDRVTEAANHAAPVVRQGAAERAGRVRRMLAARAAG